MHTIDLKNYNYRTDLIMERIDEEKKNSVIHYEKDKVKVDRLIISDENGEELNCEKGKYITIYFEDITDKDNFKNVEKILIDELKVVLNELNYNGKSILVVGLGNSKSTPDALGPMCVDNVLVTRHLFRLGDVEDGYEMVSSFKPQVTGVTGIETHDLVKCLVKEVNADILIVVDALASSSIERVNKTIQITDSGIHPGSGVGNNRGELSSKTLNIPVIAIGVPTIVDAATIVTDTFKYILKQFSYKIDNYDNKKLKLVSTMQQDYSEHPIDLTDDEKSQLLGVVGTLSDEELRNLMYEVLSPINYNLMVTPKEVDFVIEKLGLLLGGAINKSIHKRFNPTK